jgi:putative endonuclease
MNNRQVGAQKEALACEYLRQKGYVILEQNFRCRSGEIDIVARDGIYLVFVEVKFRSTNRLGGPLDAVDIRKQHKIRQVANWYLMQNRIENAWVRFDVVGILGDEIEHIKDAF